MDGTVMEIAIVGMGPRGLSVLERLSAELSVRPKAELIVHVVDPWPAGAGAVWRTGQSRVLLMNTVASQVTVFPDDSVPCRAPVRPGPSLYEWTRTMATPQRSADQSPADREEAARLRPDGYPSRALCGAYLRWAYRRILRQLPPGVTVRGHRDRAVDLCDGADGRQVLRLGGGRELTGLDAVVLAQGHLSFEATAEEREFSAYAERHGMRYVPPGNPADADLSAVGAADTVLLRGLGLCFFDYLALFTEGRGGTFVEGADGELEYRAGGSEPKILAASRRGVPYLARGDNQKGVTGRHAPVLLCPERIAELAVRAARPGGLTFCRDIWPLVAKEVELVYYRTLLVAKGQTEIELRDFERAFLPCRPGSGHECRVLSSFGIARDEHWSWDKVLTPHRGLRFAAPGQFRDWLLAHLDEDVRDARLGNVGGARKAALDVLRDLRNEIRRVVDHGGITGASYRDELRRWYTPANAFVSIGPPRRRIAQAAALIRAGVLELVGPDATVTLADAGRPGFVVESTRVPGSRRRADVLVEARLPQGGVRGTTDPLLAGLLRRGEATTYRIGSPDGDAYDTGALAVGPRPYHLLDASGRPHPRRYAVGVPTEGVHWVTAAGIRPGVGSVTVADTDAVACALVRSAVGARLALSGQAV
ncbi:FAD/NAD(P)-binding protein [Streptomyces sp. TR1341]|nr:FAD/NAD(P)-binding protein [Streptomyces sp. TR1341]